MPTFEATAVVDDNHITLVSPSSYSLVNVLCQV